MSDASPPGEGPPLLPPDWKTLAPLIDQVLDAPPERRAALILELSAGDAARQRALTHLAAECERESPLLDAPAAVRFGGLAEEPADPLLPGLVGERYQIGRELGRGGMARVYLARDLKHGRDVAIKVIRPELSASLGHDRFLREIEIAARLRHPNIVPLYDSGEVAGSLYFVMPYEEGPSLRERLAEAGALPLADALSVLRDVARALAYAHEHGVVHRDVKPDNVMLSGGAAVVTDFGIAKAVSAALTDVSGPTLTQSGSAVGTPAYMAPEQATGDPSTDHRADIYSFGCLAFEMCTGSPPFPNLSMHLVIAAHIGTVPRSVTELRTDVPAAVAQLIARCLEKDPAARPQSAREVLNTLEGISTTDSGSSAVRAAAPSRNRTLRRGLVGAGLALLAAMVYFGARSGGPSAPITLAVLPFGNTTADSATAYVADGLADEVAAALSRVPGILIKSRTGARLYRGQLTVDPAEAGAKLKADYVMTGLVRQNAGGWILSADLTRAADAASLWGENFNVGPDQAASAAEAIAESLTRALRNRFPDAVGAAPALPSNTRTGSSEAYRMFLRGQDKLNRRAQDFKESADLFRRAIHEDTLFAPAYAGLSMALAIAPYTLGVSAHDVHDGLVTAARRALDLDSTLAQPHVALGVAYQNDYQWDSADTEFQTALRVDGQSVEARVQYGRYLLFRGRHAEGLRQLGVARSEDPASAVVLSWLSYAYLLDRQVDSALVESRRALENDPTNNTSLGLGALILVENKLPDEARRVIARAPQMLPATYYVIAKLGDTAKAAQGLSELDARTPQPWLAQTLRAYTYLGLGDTARALTALELATDGKEIWPGIHGAYGPMFAPVFKSRRFQALLRRVGLAR